MSNRKQLIGLALFMVMALVVTWMVFVTLRREVSGPTNTYSATFTDVSGLYPGSDVRVAGVRVGRVDRVELDGTLARVTFRVQKDQTLFTDTVASVVYQNIIGQRYLGLLPGTTEKRTPLPNGGRIPLEHTRPSFDISYMLNGFEPMYTLLDPQQMDNFTEGIIQALQGDSGSILTLVTQTTALTEAFAGPDRVLGDVITNLSAVTSSLAEQNADLQTMISRTRDVMVTLGDRREELVASAGSTRQAVDRLATIAATVQPDLTELIKRKPGFAAHLAGDGLDRISYAAANIPFLLKGIARITQEGSYLSLYACDINITIFDFLERLIPAIVRHATPGNVIKQSPICR